MPSFKVTLEGTTALAAEDGNSGGSSWRNRLWQDDEQIVIPAELLLVFLGENFSIEPDPIPTGILIPDDPPVIPPDWDSVLPIYLKTIWLSGETRLTPFLGMGWRLSFVLRSSRADIRSTDIFARLKQIGDQGIGIHKAQFHPIVEDIV